MTGRAHARLAPSAAHRWLHCPGSVEYELQFPEPPSPYAEEGTRAHALAEWCLKNQQDTRDAPSFKPDGVTPSDWEPCDIEMLDAVQLYVDHVRSLGGSQYYEIWVDLQRFIPDSFGTMDFVTLTNDGVCRVRDLKYGKGVKVGAEDNDQLKLYALGVLLHFEGIFEIREFEIGIMQPRLDHVDVWTITSEDLLAWALVVGPLAARTLRSDAPRIPGDAACRFCKGRVQCPERAKVNIEIAQREFGEDELPPVNTITLEKLASLLPKLPELIRWAEEVSAYCLQQALSGEQVPGYKVVEGRSIRRWVDPDAAARDLLLAGYADEEVFNKKVIGLTDASRLFGNKKLGDQFVKDHCIKPPGKPSLALESDPRPAMTLTDAAQDFSEGD